MQLSACLVFRGRCRTLRGEIDAALGDLREGFDMISEHGVHAMLGYATGLLALAQLERGDVDGAAETIAAPGFPEELPSRIVINFFQIARGRLRIETGEVERGVEDLLTVGRRCHEIASDNVDIRKLNARGQIDDASVRDRGLADVDRQRTGGVCTLRARERVAEDVADAVRSAGIAHVVVIALRIHRQDAVLAGRLKIAGVPAGRTARAMDLHDGSRRVRAGGAS